MLVGITGRIGAGKTTLATMLEVMGAVVLDADQVGHDVIEIPSVRAKLVARFGADIVTGADTLDRRELGRRAFVDSESKNALESIVRAPLQKELWKRVRAAEQSLGAQGVVVVDAALILEWGQSESFDRLIVVTASDEQSISRLHSGRGLSAGEVRQRMASQTSSEHQIAQADIVVDNDGDLKALQSAAERIWLTLRSSGDGSSSDGSSGDGEKSP